MLETVPNQPRFHLFTVQTSNGFKVANQQQLIFDGMNFCTLQKFGRKPLSSVAWFNFQVFNFPLVAPKFCQRQFGNRLAFDSLGYLHGQLFLGGVNNLILW